jgi:DNA (cytosine-5)-methyltransferase 1
VEIEVYAVANLIAKMEKGLLDSCPIWTDLKEFPYKDFHGKVNILSAGFPCQPFSSAGKRRATEDPRHLYPWIANGITDMQPEYVFLENVQGIISAKTGDGESVLKYVLGDLEKRGYSCTWGIFSASLIGAPHQRKRVFILGKKMEYSSGEGLEGGTRESLQGGSDGLACTSREELADSSSRRGEGLLNRHTETGDVIASSPTKMGNTDCSRFEKCKTGRLLQSQPKSWANFNRSNSYPRKPGQEQHEWEEPRTITTESSMGLSTHGIKSRVDELRLLGNGVCPDTCEIAFSYLFEKLHQ